jgi:hypothetical protein
MKWRFGRGLRRRYGHAGKRSEGVRVHREKGRIYYVAGSGEVMSALRKNR